MHESTLQLVIVLTLLHVFDLNDLRCSYIGICQLNMLSKLYVYLNDLRCSHIGICQLNMLINLYVYFQISLICLDPINDIK